MIAGDCGNIIRDLQSTSTCLSSAGVFVKEIKSLGPVLACETFNFTPRLEITLAHSLARNFSEDDDRGNVLPSDMLQFIICKMLMKMPI